MQEIKKILALKLEKYINIIIKEYHNYLSKEKINELQNINFLDTIEIADTGTITILVMDNKIYFPTEAVNVINKLKKHPQYNTDKNHKAYTNDNILTNDNTFIDYINHAIIRGIEPLDYYLENLLHESFHISGIVGVGVMSEAFTELKTRELALKYNLETSGCGYPKEVKLALKLQNILGEEIVNKIMFMNNIEEQLDYIDKTLGRETSNFYEQIYLEMKKEFNKYNATSQKDPYKKAKDYEQLDYSKVYDLLNSYEKNRNNR